jgi:rubrerythrin
MKMKNVLFLAVIVLFALTGCEQPKPTKTIDDLKAAYTGESTASAKYAAFAQKANEEGFDTIAKLFEAASKAESIHAENHKKVLEELGEKVEVVKPVFEVKTTAENLQAAIDGETYEVNTMYPQFLADAKSEKVEKAEKTFTWAFETEKKHIAFYTKVSDELKANNSEKNLTNQYMVCPVCGNTFEKATADENCAFCMTSREKFINI